MRLSELGPDRRLLLQAPVFPATGALQAALDGMAADAATYPGRGVEDLHPHARRLPARRRAGRRAAGPGRRARAPDPRRPQGSGRRGRRPRHRPTSARPPRPTRTPPSSSTTPAGRPAPPRARTSRPARGGATRRRPSADQPAGRGHRSRRQRLRRAGQHLVQPGQGPRQRGARARQAADPPRPGAHPVGHRLHLVRLAAGPDRRLPDLRDQRGVPGALRLPGADGRGEGRSSSAATRPGCTACSGRQCAPNSTSRVVDRRSSSKPRSR